MIILDIILELIGLGIILGSGYLFYKKMLPRIIKEIKRIWNETE